MLQLLGAAGEILVNDGDHKIPRARKLYELRGELFYLYNYCFTWFQQQLTTARLRLKMRIRGKIVYFAFLLTELQKPRSTNVMRVI